MLPRRSLPLSHAPHSTSCHRLPLFTSPTIPTPSIFPRKALSENAPRLRNFRKYPTKMLFACGTPANIAQKRILLAELPQILHKNASYLRNFRKYYTKVNFVCGSSANMIQKRFLLAEFPQMLHKSAFCLRNFRKYYAKVHLTRGTSANMIQKCILLAELPQIACNLRIHLIIL